MTTGSLGIRSGSYGSLPQHLQTQHLQTNGGAPSRKPVKMFKEKERVIHWIFKFAGRKKVGMLFLCVISAAVFGWVLYVGKGEDAQEGERINISIYYGSMGILHPESPPGPPPNGKFGFVLRPPPPKEFLGYTFPQGHPCNNFTLPPPPADKKRTGPRPCDVCYLPVEEAYALMPKDSSPSPILKNLTYVVDDKPTKSDESFGGSDFGGYPSLKDRNDSFNIRESMSVHCGFVRGSPGRQTGFDMDEPDMREMEQCRDVVVVSAIFGNFDAINQPRNISDKAKEEVCFYMFVDEETEAYLKNYGALDSSKRIGLWRIVVVHNLPYTDARRTGKIPKLLTQRLFPNACFSIWIDGKLELVVDPYQILERFLWRKNVTLAISRHYKRFDVFTEAEANKAAGKYDNSSIDFQIEFYKREGLTPYSEDKLPIISDVPEGCVIIREHNPLTNLFHCLWFNEVNFFTPRDQLSFCPVRDKILSQVNWAIDMFWDCERRNFVVQKYHRDVLEHIAPPIAVYPPPPPALEPPTKPSVETSPGKVASTPNRGRRGRDRKSGRRHRKVVAGSRDNE